MSAEEIVQQQLDAYNARDLIKFLACHDQNIALFNFGEAVPYATGTSGLKAIYEEVFLNSPDLNAKLVNRIVLDNKVIDHEHVTGRKGVELVEIIAIYEVENGLISKAHFIRKK